MDNRAPSSIGIETDEGAMPAKVWLPPEGTGPGIVVFHEIFGVSDYIARRCNDLAALGYVVCAPEIFWRLGVRALPEEGEDAVQEAVAMAARVDWPRAVSDGVSALQHLSGMIEVTGGVGVLGFCFGGGLAFAVAADADPDVLVSYYGSALPTLLDRAADITAPSLHHFGLADSYFPQETVRTIEAAVTAVPGARFETYPGADHAFDSPSPRFHHPEASRAAWGVTTRFLAEVLQPREAGGSAGTDRKLT
jgi:carboxymethylenebutenolidase